MPWQTGTPLPPQQIPGVSSSHRSSQSDQSRTTKVFHVRKLHEGECLTCVRMLPLGANGKSPARLLGVLQIFGFGLRSSLSPSLSCHKACLDHVSILLRLRGSTLQLYACQDKLERQVCFVLLCSHCEPLLQLLHTQTGVPPFRSGKPCRDCSANCTFNQDQPHEPPPTPPPGPPLLTAHPPLGSCGAPRRAFGVQSSGQTSSAKSKPC